MSSDFRYVKAPLVVAFGDDVQTLVWRSEAVSVNSASYAPVKAQLEETGMVLLEEELLPSDPLIYGRCFKSWFAVPSARNLLMQYPEEENDD